MNFMTTDSIQKANIRIMGISEGEEGVMATRNLLKKELIRTSQT